MSKGSDSSKKLRSELNATQVENHVPNVDNSVAFAKYLSHAGNLYKTALDSYKQRNWQYSYVQYKILTSFCVKLFKHKAYKEAQHEKDREVLNKYINGAFKILEDVVVKLDEIEDEKIKQSEFALMDELESLMEEEEHEHPQTETSAAPNDDTQTIGAPLKGGRPNLDLINEADACIRFVG